MAINVKKKIFKENNTPKNLTNLSFVLYYIHNQMKERGILMNIQKLLATTVLTVAVGTMATASQDVYASQKMLNSLGYNAGPIDGIVGSKTTSAMKNYYADKGMTFDGTIDGNEVALLKTDAGNLNLTLEQEANQLGVHMSGHYIDESMKNGIGKYVLPSRDWMKKYVNNDRDIFYREGGFFGDFDGDGQLDYITWGTGSSCKGAGASSKEGRIGCSDINAVEFPYQIYSVDKSFNFKKLNKYDAIDWGKANDKGYPAGTSRIIVEDFNGDGIDDFFIANAAVELVNGKFSYNGVNPVLISTGPYQWKASVHTGHKVDKKTGTFTEFSHGSDTGDIDNDGDIDVMTANFSGVTCHYNDGKGNFKAKKCINKDGFVLSAGDFNNDGNLDIVAGNAHYNAKYRKYSQQSFLKETKNSHYIALYYGNGKGKFKRVHKLEAPKVGNFIFSEAPEMTAFDYDRDGDLDLVSSHVGMYYSGSAWVAYENVNGQLKLGDVNIILAPLDEWQDPKVWGSMVKSESKHPWNTYCSKGILIDVNSDGLMDVLCDNAVQHYRMTNTFLINKGNMQFDFVKSDEVKKWVHWMDN
tara:strand:- start:1263 stop:3008 length:1746 start_codon:yes stop_codon:yes gene_type:complete